MNFSKKLWDPSHEASHCISLHWVWRSEGRLMWIFGLRFHQAMETNLLLISSYWQATLLSGSGSRGTCVGCSYPQETAQIFIWSTINFKVFLFNNVSIYTHIHISYTYIYIYGHVWYRNLPHDIKQIIAKVQSLTMIWPQSASIVWIYRPYEYCVCC